MNTHVRLVVAVVCTVIACPAFAQKPVVYPAKGQNAQHQQAMSTFYRAYGACMQGRGYSIK
jgi:hypothetical protein